MTSAINLFNNNITLVPDDQGIVGLRLDMSSDTGDLVEVNLSDTESLLNLIEEMEKFETFRRRQMAGNVNWVHRHHKNGDFDKALAKFASLTPEELELLRERHPGLETKLIEVPKPPQPDPQPEPQPDTVGPEANDETEKALKEFLELIKNRRRPRNKDVGRRRREAFFAKQRWHQCKLDTWGYWFLNDTSKRLKI